MAREEVKRIMQKAEGEPSRHCEPQAKQPTPMDACIILSNGRTFWGTALGATGVAVGEAVFNTGMNGYIETLTDPSYFGQIVVQTFPLIGNYGIISEDFESAGPHVKGYVVRRAMEPSNFRSGGTVDDFLKSHGIIGIQGVDTRALTRTLREKGVMNAMIVSGESAEAQRIMAEVSTEQASAPLSGLPSDFAAPCVAPLDKIVSRRPIEAMTEYKVIDAVDSVSLDADAVAQDAQTVFEQSARYRFVPVDEHGVRQSLESFMSGLSSAVISGSLSGSPSSEAYRGVDATCDASLDKNVSRRPKRHVVLWDFGAKANIRRELLKRGLDVVTVGSKAAADQILAMHPDGVMLSNGPGDPQDNAHIIEELRKVMDSGVSTFGICLGHQLMALAMGAATVKLKYGHRGANQPVKCLATGRVYITSQNHGYAVSTLPAGGEMSFVNANDGTCEGITYPGRRAFSVQFHPEACSGPLDTSFLFDDFVRMMGE